jgi:predicted permease
VPAQSAANWEQVAEHLRSVPGIETVTLANRPLLGGNSWNGSISTNGGPVSDDLAYFMSVSPGWLSAMKIPLISGRDFRATDTDPGSAIVSESFAKEYLRGGNPLGKTFQVGESVGRQVIGIVRDARYRSVRDPIPPVAYFPFRLLDKAGQAAKLDQATLVVRTASTNPLALASALRRETPRARAGFRVSNISTQQEINESYTVRERLLAALAMFFAAVALLLAAIGLYGVLDYSVLQRRREIGIRMAIGAQAGHVARSVAADVFAMVLAGSLAGLGLGLASARYIEALFYQVKPTDLAILALPGLTIVATALLAALPAVLRAVRIDPVAILRSE